MTFKQEYSNFRIVIVVDMWITGFDVPCLTYLYNDKPLQKHTLVQTVSRVNRKYPGKDFGYIIDYIGIRNNMMEAMKKYGGETFGPSEDDVQQALGALLVELELIKQIFVGFNLNPFIDKASKPLDRLECLGKASEHILTLSKMFNVAKESKAPKSRCQNILLGSHQASENRLRHLSTFKRAESRAVVVVTVLYVRSYLHSQSIRRKARYGEYEPCRAAYGSRSVAVQQRSKHT